MEWRLDHGAEVVTIEPGDALVVKLDLLRIVDQIAKKGAGSSCPASRGPTPRARPILQLTNEGRASAEGTSFGRKPKLAKNQAVQSISGEL